MRQQRLVFHRFDFLLWTFFAWFLTFTIILPFLAQKWVYSPYFYTSPDFVNNAPAIADDFNLRRYERAKNFLESLNPDENIRNYFDALDTNATTEIVIMVITKRRTLKKCRGVKSGTLECEPHYLQQVLAEIDRENKAYSKSKDNANLFPVVICNVDPDWEKFQDLITLRRTFPVIDRYEQYTQLDGSSRRAQETSDYAFCLESILNKTRESSPNYVLVFEDDAVMFSNFFSYLFHILDFRIKAKIRKGELVKVQEEAWSYMQLYYPEKWAGYSWDSSKLLELLSVGLLGGMSGTLLFSKFQKFKIFQKQCIPHLFVFFVYALYWVLVVVVISRQTLIEVRRMSPAFLKLSPAPGCCTQAVIYPTNKLTSIVNYLKSSDCLKCSQGVDLAIHDFSQTIGLKSYLVQPNLVRHIGIHSTLTGEKNPVQMMFYDLLYE